MTPYRASLLAVSLVLAVAGCINLPDIEPDEPRAEEPLPDLGVRLLTPSATTYTNGTVDVSVEVRNGTPETVDLFAGDELIATLPSPYTFRWDTTTKPEGTYTLTAKARRGEQSFASEARTVVVDRTPPQVVSRLPVPGAQNISVNQPIQANFTELIDRTTLTAESVQLIVGQGQVTSQLAVSPDGRSLTVLPLSKPIVPATASLELSNNIKDLAGNPLVLPSDSWSWRLPGFIALRAEPVVSASGSGVFLSGHCMAVSQTGELLAAWSIYEINGQTKSLIYARRWTNGTWEPVGDVVRSDPGYPHASGLSLAFDLEGRPVLAWIGSGSGNGSKIFVRRWSGDAWEFVGAPLSANAGSVSISALSMVIDSRNKPVLAWRERLSDSFPSNIDNIYVGRWTGATWEPLGTAISANGGRTSVEPPSLALEAGRPVLAWAEPASEEAYSSNNPYVSRWEATSWQSVGGLSRGIPGEISTLFTIKIGVDPLGRLLAVWDEYLEPITASSVSSVYAYRWEEGQGWRPLGEALNAVPGRKTARIPSFAFQPDGAPVVAWLEKDLQGVENVYVKRWMGDGWHSLDDALSALPGMTDASEPVVQIDSEGYPLIMWKESIEGTSERAVYVYRYNR